MEQEHSVFRKHLLRAADIVQIQKQLKKRVTEHVPEFNSMNIYIIKHAKMMQSFKRINSYKYNLELTEN